MWSMQPPALWSQVIGVDPEGSILHNEDAPVGMYHVEVASLLCSGYRGVPA